jgi:hypothetical protein
MKSTQRFQEEMRRNFDPKPRKNKKARQQLPHIGAVFDFAGYITTRADAIRVGSAANARPVADLVKQWAKLRGLRLDSALVLSWQEALGTTPQGDQDVD